jgi:hypothetical protein
MTHLFALFFVYINGCLRLCPLRKTSNYNTVISNVNTAQRRKNPFFAKTHWNNAVLVGGNGRNCITESGSGRRRKRRLRIDERDCCAARLTSAPNGLHDDDDACLLKVGTRRREPRMVRGRVEILIRTEVSRSQGGSRRADRRDLWVDSLEKELVYWFPAKSDHKLYSAACLDNLKR